MLIRYKATYKDKAQPLANAGTERLPVATAVAINTIPTAFEIVATC